MLLVPVVAIQSGDSMLALKFFEFFSADCPAQKLKFFKFFSADCRTPQLLDQQRSENEDP